MKSIVFISSLFLLIACNQSPSHEKELQNRVDSLQKQLNETYRPGLGEFMSGIQTHHAKLWFAGINQNWPLADFEVNEIKESMEDVQKFCADRPELKSINMINPVIDSMNNAIQQKNLQLFTASFTLLTNTCNNCHKTTDHGFNVVTIPVSPPVSNQDFKPAK